MDRNRERDREGGREKTRGQGVNIWVRGKRLQAPATELQLGLKALERSAIKFWVLSRRQTAKPQ